MKQVDRATAKVCIYTAIYGGYEKLLPQPAQIVDCDFICFTDDPQLTAEGWKVLYSAGDPALDLRMQSKLSKLNPYGVCASKVNANPGAESPQDLSAYDYTIWIDANAVIRDRTFVQEVLGYLGRFGIAMFVHPERDCIYDEAEVCLTMPKHQVTPIREQVSQYRSEGYPAHNGLFACGLIARDMRRPEVRRLSGAWWEENLRWLTIDQIALPYVLSRHRYGCDPIRQYLWNNQLLRWERHHLELVTLYEKYGVVPQPAGLPLGHCEGYVDLIDCRVVSGWVWDPRLPETPLAIDIYDNETKLCTIAADMFREDLILAGKGNGVHGFIYHIPDALRDGRPHSIWVGISSTPQALNKEAPVVITCAPRAECKWNYETAEQG